MEPSEVPISEVEVEVGEKFATNFTIGSEDSWFVEWVDSNEDDSQKFHCNGK